MRESLPGVVTRRPFQGANQIAGDPSPVEVARLRLHALVVKPCDIHATGIERDVIAQRLIPPVRSRVASGDCVRPVPGNEHIEVTRFALTPRRTLVAISKPRRTSAGGI